MAMYLKDILKQANDKLKGVRTSTTEPASTGKDAGVDYKPKSGDEADFIAKHSVQKWDEPYGNPNYADKVGYVLKKPEEKRHGNTETKAKATNEEVEQLDEIGDTKRGQKLINKVHKRASERLGKAVANKDPKNARKYQEIGHQAWDRMPSNKYEEVEQVDELSTDLLHRAAHKAAKLAMTDVQGRSGPIFKKRAAQANKFRAKGMEQEKKEKAAKAVKEEIESIDEISKKLAARYNNKVGREINKNQPNDPDKLRKRNNREAGSKLSFAKYHGYKVKVPATEEIEQVDELSKKTLGSYAQSATRDALSRQYALGKGDKTDTRRLMNRRKGIDKAVDKLTKEETVEEGAKVDRMVAHIKSSEKSIGKSDKNAENIAWATANKRGMLDNKNKKMEEDVQGIAKKYKDYVTGGGTPDTASRYKSHVNMHAKKTGQHPDAINKEVRKHVKSMNEDLAIPLLGGDHPPRGDSDEAIEMVKAELKALANKAMHLVMQMPEGMHVEPWCQAKIAQAKSYVSDVHDYMVFGDHEENEQMDTPLTVPNMSVDINTGQNV